MAQDVEGRTLRLGSAILDLDRGTLSRNGRLLPLRAKAFAVLAALVREPGRVVPKEELLDAAWPGIHVTEDSLTQAIRDIRRHLGDDGTILRTVARRGFVLMPNASGAAPPQPAPASRPRIAVLPLADRTGDPSRGPVVEALAEEVAGGLARFRNLVVVARHSAATAAREGLDLPGIGARLGAAYVVDGSARLAAGQLRLTFALNDIAEGEVLWSESFDAGPEGWISLQDLVPRQIVARLFSSIEEAGRRASLGRAPQSLSAFELFARGLSVFRGYDADSNERARALFAAALEADPSYGVAHAFLGMTEVAVHGYGLAPPEVKLRARAAALRAVELWPDDARCWSRLAYLRALNGEFAAAEADARRAVELNPCDADALLYLAFVLVPRGRSLEALDWLDRAKSLNPLWPAHYDDTAADALFALGRYEEATQALRRIPRLSARQELQLAAALIRQGDRDGARLAAARAPTSSPTPASSGPRRTRRNFAT